MGELGDFLLHVLDGEMGVGHALLVVELVPASLHHPGQQIPSQPGYPPDALMAKLLHPAKASLNMQRQHSKLLLKPCYILRLQGALLGQAGILAAQGRQLRHERGFVLLVGGLELEQVAAVLGQPLLQVG